MEIGDQHAAYIYLLMCSNLFLNNLTFISHYNYRTYQQRQNKKNICNWETKEQNEISVRCHRWVSWRRRCQSACTLNTEDSFCSQPHVAVKGAAFYYWHFSVGFTLQPQKIVSDARCSRPISILGVISGKYNMRHGLSECWKNNNYGLGWTWTPTTPFSNMFIIGL